MKTLLLFKSILLSTVLFLSFQTANAKVFFIGETQVGINVSAENSRMNVKVARIGSDALELTVYNNNKEVLFQETLKGAGQLNKTYDLHQFPDGEYTIAFRKPLMETVQPFTISEKIVTLSDDQRRIKLMPEIRLKHNHLKFSLILNDFSALNCHIYDKYGRQILAEELGESIAFNHQYDLSKMEPGQYTVELKTDTEVFRKNFEVK